MVGEDFDALDVTERADKVAGARERFVVVADARDEHVADPDGLFDFVQVAEEFDDVLVAESREALVRFAVDVLDVDEQKVCRFHQSFDFSECFTGASERDSACVEACVDACCFGGFEKLDHKVDLCERFATAHGNAAVTAPVGLVADGLFQQVFCRDFERAVLGSVRALFAKVPSFRVVAKLAAHGAALRKDDKSNSRSIDRAERFKLIDSSESHDAKIKNCVFVLRGIFCGVL